MRFAIAAVLLLTLAIPAVTTTHLTGGQYPELGGDIRTVSTLVSDSVGTLSISPNGLILATFTRDDSPTGPTSNPCHIAVSDDEGVTWGPSKFVGITTTIGGTCTAAWIDDDSFVVAGGNQVRVTHDGGLTFADKNPSGFGAGAGTRTEIFVEDANNWAAFTAGLFAYTSNAGTSWTVNTLTGCCSDMTGSPTSGSWVAIQSGVAEPSARCTTDNFLTTTGGAVSGTAGLGNAELRGAASVTGGYGYTFLYTAGNSFDGINRDLGITRSDTCGASWGHVRIYPSNEDAYASGTIGRLVNAENGEAYVAFRTTAGKSIVAKIDTLANNDYQLNLAEIEDLNGLTPSFANSDWATFEGRLYGLFEENNLAKIVVADDLGNAVVSSTQIAVNGLVGASMDATGRSILTRENSVGLSTTINVYSGLNLANGAVATTTSDCGQLDGVLSTTLNDEIYNVYLDCDDTGLTDTIRIRNAALDDPNFSNPDCTETDPDVSADDFGEFGNVPFPPNMRQIGTMNDLSIAYNKCDNSGTNHAAASITFSTTGTLAQGGGRIGVYGWVFNNLGFDNTDSASVQLDTNANPFVDQFCSYQDFTGSGHDFIGGVSRQGPTGLYHVTNSVSGTGAEQVEVDIEQVYLNANPYGQAKGIDCVNGDAVILQDDRFVRIANAFIPGGTKTFIEQEINGATQVRGIAMSRIYQFTAWTDGPDIKIGWLDPAISNTTYTITATFPIPPGQFVGMEFTEQAEFLAVYTSDFITVFNTAPVTCELLTCDNDASGDDGGTTCTVNCEGPDPSPDPDDPDTPRGIAGLNRSNSIWASLATIASFGIIALLVLRRRRDLE